MMKRLLFFFALLLVATATFATGQTSDVIYIGGMRWQLLGRPIYSDSKLFRELIAVLPKDRSRSTANWDGFTSFWSIRQNALCLDSIQYQLYDNATRKSWTECVPAETLQRVFKKYSNGTTIVASWLTEDIRVGKGEQIYYLHQFFDRFYEEEQIISIDHGKVSDVKTFHNYVVDGFSFDNIKNAAELREKFPLHIERYPELSGAKRIIFQISKVRVDSTGHLLDCKVKVYLPEGVDKLAEEMEEAMKAYYPWRVMFINGEYRAFGIEGFTIPYRLDNNE
jgi:hypothetical protein